MKRNFLFAAVFTLAVIFAAVGSAEAQNKAGIGDTIENFSLPDLEGKTLSLADLKGEKGAVIVFLSAQCPVVRGYNERINQIAADYKQKGITFIGINSNATEDLNRVKDSVNKAGYKFPVLIDKENVLADKLGAQVTPEMFFLDASNKLIYHGAIDNDRSGQNIKESYLRVSMDENLSGKQVTKSETKAFGCTIKRKS